MTATSSVNQPSDPYLNAEVGNTRWASGSLTYSFPMTAAMYEVPYGGSNEPLRNFGALSSTQQTAARMALSQYSAVANLTFTERTLVDAPSATIRLAMSDAPSTAWAYLPSTTSMGGDVWFNKSGGQYNNPVVGNYAYATFMHELGHALGLEHPHENGMPADRDSLEYTVMTYRSYLGGSTTSGYVNETWGFPQTLMMYDIAAIQYLYGANFTTNNGNTTYSWSPTTGQEFINGVAQTAPGANKIFMTLWDGGGTDTYDFSNYGTNLTIDLRPGQWTTTSSSQLARLYYNGSQIAHGNIANALQFNGDARSLIENASGGSGNDTIVGNAANNLIQGNGGNDTLDGQGGSDIFAFRGIVSQYTFSAYADGVQVTDTVAGRDGVDICYNFEYLKFADQVLAIDMVLRGNYALSASFDASGYFIGAIGHFDSDSDDDLMWRNSAGDVFVWRMQSGQPVSSTTLATGISGWHLLGVGDIDADGDDDYIWHNTSNGEVAVWYIQNGAIASTGQLSPTFAGWSMIGMADINADDDDDILWLNNSTNQVAVWDMQGGQVAGTRGLASNVAGWKPLAVGDLNGDGDDDVLWLNTSTKQVSAWTVQNGQVVGTKAISSNTSGFEFQTLGDFDGDSDMDVVWKGPNGTIYAWAIQNGQVAGSALISQQGNNWNIVGSGDFNNDGIDELVVSSADGKWIQMWALDDPLFAHVAQAVPVATGAEEESQPYNVRDWVGNTYAELFIA